MNPAIVINAYKRPESLRRLLKSLQGAVIDRDTKLVFSLEHGAHEDVLAQVKTFEWPYGEKVMIQQPEKLGLVGHFFFCGGLTAEYGTIIYLEDDLFVGRDFYTYAQAVLKAYEHQERLAGFSLNSLWFNGYQHLPFRPVDDGNPCFFLQVPWYQGQVYTARQWQHFKHWHDKYKGADADMQIHPLLTQMSPADEWFGVKTQYMIETGKYYCFPRVAHCVNFGDAGTHFENKTNFFQAELALAYNHTPFIPLDDSIAVYDSFFELLPQRLKAIAPHLKDIDFETDLNGMKDLAKVKSEYVITPVKPKTYLKKYALEMRPQELNIVYETEGDFFYLAKTKDVQGLSQDKGVFYQQFFYHNRFKLSRRQKLSLLFRK